MMEDWRLDGLIIKAGWRMNGGMTEMDRWRREGLTLCGGAAPLRLTLLPPAVQVLQGVKVSLARRARRKLLPRH